MMKLSMGLPERDEEIAILNRYMSEEPLTKLNAVMTLEELQQAKKDANNVFVHPCILKYMVDIIGATRNAEGILIPPPLRFDILAEIEKRIPGFPIVLHGSSSVPQDQVAIINKFGGAMKDAIGIPEEQLRQAAKSAVCKVNIDSDGRIVMTAAVRQVLVEKPAEFDPRKYLGPARDNLKALYEHKIINVLGSAQRV